MTSINNSVKRKAVRQALKAAGTVGLFNVYGKVRSLIKSRKIAVLAYHRIDHDTNYPWTITPVTPGVFELEMKYLKKKFQVISLEELGAALQHLDELPPNTAVVTIDDGYKDVYTNAYPVLKKYNIPATVFLTTGLIGTGELLWTHKVRYLVRQTRLGIIELEPLGTFKSDSSDDAIQAGNTIVNRLKKLPLKTRDEYIDKLVGLCGVDIPVDIGKSLFLNWDEVREMNDNGVNFGAHTVSHPILSRVPPEEAKNEILNSKLRIEKELGQEITTFCYPNGEPDDFNDGTIEILKNIGFRYSVTLVPEAFVSSGTDRYRIPRMTGASSYEMFELLMSGLYSDTYAILKRLRNNS